MAIVRIEWLRALAARIAAEVPELAGKVKAGQQPTSVDQTYPTLTITLPSKLTFEAHGESEHATIGNPADGNVVFNVGAHAGPVLLRLTATTIGERNALEQRVINLFEKQELRPGVLIVPVATVPELSSWISAFEYESSQWNDAEALDRKHESLIMLNGIIPALVARSEVYEIDELALGLANSFANPFTPATLVPPAAEVVVINEDGTISPYTP